MNESKQKTQKTNVPRGLRPKYLENSKAKMLLQAISSTSYT